MPYKRYKEKKINCQKRKKKQLSEEKKKQTIVRREKKKLSEEKTNVRKDVSFTWNNGALVEKTKSE